MPHHHMLPTPEDLKNILDAFDLYTHLMIVKPSQGHHRAANHARLFGEVTRDLQRLTSPFALSDLARGFAQHSNLCYPRELPAREIDAMIDALRTLSDQSAVA